MNTNVHPAVKALVANPETFTLAMERAVTMRGPGFIYRPKFSIETGNKRCWYRDPSGECGCIIGLALNLCGVPYDPRWEGNSALWVLEGLGMPSAYINAAQNAQGSQDRGDVYNSALSAYRKTLVFHDTGLTGERLGRINEWGHNGAKPWEASR